jgi:nicotinamidase-related amidase
MPHPSLLKPERTALAVVDFQEAFRKIIPEFDQIGAAISKAVQGFRILDLPIVVTEQYPKGLGHTISEVTDALPTHFNFVEKTAFSSCGAGAFLQKLQATNTRQVLVCGIETHICVNQTAHDLLNEGFEVHLLTDAVGSRFEINKQAGLKKMFASGVIPSSVEMALFELMADSRHEKFKEIQALIK